MINKLATALMVSALLVGCSGNKTKPNSTGGSASASGVDQTQGVSSMGSLTSADGGLSTLSSQDHAALDQLSKKVYFAYNRYDLNAQGQQTTQANANFLLQHPGLAVLLAGHADPRGSQEYNFHLGEKRADAVKDALLQQGISANQICTVSYGELKPAASPQDFGGNWQKAYDLDRRVEFTYGQGCQQGQGNMPSNLKGAL